MARRLSRRRVHAARRAVAARRAAAVRRCRLSTAREHQRPELVRPKQPPGGDLACRLRRLGHRQRPDRRWQPNHLEQQQLSLWVLVMEQRQILLEH